MNLLKLLLLAFLPLNAPGKLIFAPIEQVEKGWDENTYYLWGANLGNYRIRDPKASLSGGGMASKRGPTSGMGHPNYVGVITVSKSFEENDRVFEELKEKLLAGANVVIPIYNGQFSLGAGIGKGRFSKGEDWEEIQRYLFEKIGELSKLASETIIPEGTYWSDFEGNRHPIKVNVHPMVST